MDVRKYWSADTHETSFLTDFRDRGDISATTGLRSRVDIRIQGTPKAAEMQGMPNVAEASSRQVFVEEFRLPSHACHDWVNEYYRFS